MAHRLLQLQSLPRHLLTLPRLHASLLEAAQPASLRFFRAAEKRLPSNQLATACPSVRPQPRVRTGSWCTALQIDPPVHLLRRTVTQSTPHTNRAPHMHPRPDISLSGLILLDHHFTADTHTHRYKQTDRQTGRPAGFIHWLALLQHTDTDSFCISLLSSTPPPSLPPPHPRYSTARPSSYLSRYVLTYFFYVICYNYT